MNLAASYRVPKDRRDRFEEVAHHLTAFGGEHLDAELTGFTLELWARVCRRRDPACLRGKSTVWAAAVVHVISRLNFLHDRSQPVHLTMDTLCGSFGVSKKTVGPKATAIERGLGLHSYGEPGITRRSLLEQFTMLRNPNGMVLSFEMARDMGYLPPDAKVEDFF